jgi:hypothetical protein
MCGQKAISDGRSCSKGAHRETHNSPETRRTVADCTMGLGLTPSYLIRCDHISTPDIQDSWTALFGRLVDGRAKDKAERECKSIATMGRSYRRWLVSVASKAGLSAAIPIKKLWLCFWSSTSDYTDDAKRPIRRPSGIVA